MVGKLGPPLRYIAEKYRPDSVFQIGCGTGGYLQYLKSVGSQEIFGVDGLPTEATFLSTDEYQKVDFQAPIDLKKTFDLVVCIEAGEHLEPETTGVALDSIARHAKELILFSMAKPNQPENGHISCLPMSEILELWAQRGWAPDLSDTLGLRSLSTVSWLRRDIMVLKRSQAKDELPTVALQEIDAMQYDWHRQISGIRMNPFQENLPEGFVSYPNQKTHF